MYKDNRYTLRDFTSDFCSVGVRVQFNCHEIFKRYIGKRNEMMEIKIQKNGDNNVRREDDDFVSYFTFSEPGLVWRRLVEYPHVCE